MIDVIGLARTPFSPILGQLSSISAVKLGVKSASRCINNSFVNKEVIDTLVLSQAFPYGLGPSPSRQISTDLGLSNCATYNVSNSSTSGLRALDLAYDLIKLGKSQVLTVVGSESCSNIPFLLKDVRCNGYKFGNNTLFDPLINDLINLDPNQPNLESECNKYIGECYKRMESLYSQGVIQNELAPITVQLLNNNKMMDKNICEDELLRNVNRRLTAHKGTNFADGSASLLLCSKEFTKRWNLKPICRIVSTNTTAIGDSASSTSSWEDLVTSMTKWVQEFKADIFEILDQTPLIPVLSCKVGNLDMSRVNLQGGSVSVGHPLGATGVRQVISLITSLKSLNLRFGLAIGSDLHGNLTTILVENT